MLKSWALSENTVTDRDKSVIRSAVTPKKTVGIYRKLIGKKVAEMHAKIMVRSQIAWSDALRACIPKCMQIVHTLDPQGYIYIYTIL